MATVEFSLNDFNGLVGKKMTAGQVEDTCSMLGMPKERFEEGRLTVEVSPNRPDWLSVEGIARSVSSYNSVTTGLRKYEYAKPALEISVDKSFLDARPYVAAAVARNVKLSDEFLRSMVQLQEKLCDTLGRKRRKVAMGTYDISKVKFPLSYKGFKPDEISFVPLATNSKLTLSKVLSDHPKGQQYGHIIKEFARYPVISDSAGDVLCLIPVTNGESSRMDEKTTDLFIEVNGTSRQAVDDSLNILCAQLADRGAKMEKMKFTGAFESSTPHESPKIAQTSPEAVFKLLGIRLTPPEIAAHLERMGYAAADSGQKIKVTIPAYRNDIMHERDVIEDVGIAYGYGNFTGRMPPFPTIGSKHPVEAFADHQRELMAGLGFQDCVTFTLTNEEAHFKRMLLSFHDRVQIENPLTQETTMVRTSILPSLLSVLEANKGQKYPQKLFEVGDTVLLDDSAPNGCVTKKKLCAVIASKVAGLSEIKSVLEALIKELGLEHRFERHDEPFFIKTRSAKVAGAKMGGHFGEIHPQVLENFGLNMPVAAFEVWFG